MFRERASPRLHGVLRRVLALLRKIAPTRTEGDIQWNGPYYIARPGRWWPSRFVLYRRELYCTIELGWSSLTLSWRTDGDRISLDRGSSGLGPGGSPELWEEVLEQIERRLRAALANPEVYNRRVARLLPLACRVGRVLRRLTWAKGRRLR